MDEDQKRRQEEEAAAAKRRQEEEAAAAARQAAIQGGLSAPSSSTGLNVGSSAPAVVVPDARTLQANMLEERRLEEEAARTQTGGIPSGAMARAEAGTGAATSSFAPLPTQPSQPLGPSGAMPGPQSSIFTELAGNISAYRALVGQIQFVDRPQFVQSNTIPVDPNDAIRERYVQAFARREMAKMEAALAGGASMTSPLPAAQQPAPTPAATTPRPVGGPPVNPAAVALSAPQSQGDLTYRPASANGTAAAASGQNGARPNPRPYTF